MRKRIKNLEASECRFNGDGTISILIDSPKYGHFEALIDCEDWEKVMRYKWSVQRSPGSVEGRNFYVTRELRRNSTTCKREIIQLHRFLMEEELTNNPERPIVDHIDGQPLNNTKNNLRCVNARENKYNQLNIKGYYWIKKYNKYRAVITSKRKTKHLGYFKTEEEAHQAYLKAKEKYHKIGD